MLVTAETKTIFKVIRKNIFQTLTVCRVQTAAIKAQTNAIGSLEQLKVETPSDRVVRKGLSPEVAAQAAKAGRSQEAGFIILLPAH